MPDLLEIPLWVLSRTKGRRRHGHNFDIGTQNRDKVITETINLPEHHTADLRTAFVQKWDLTPLSDERLLSSHTLKGLRQTRKVSANTVGFLHITNVN